MKSIFHFFCDVYGPRLMNNRHYLPKSKSTAADTRNTKSVLWYNISFSYFFFFLPTKKIWNALGSLSQLRYRWSQSNVEHGQHSQKMFSVYFLVNNFHGKKMTIALMVASSLQKAKRMEYFHAELKCTHCWAMKTN